MTNEAADHESDALWDEYRRTGAPELRNRLVERYASLVWRVAERVQIAFAQGHETEDLVGYGVLGLIEAVERYDPSRGVRFETYAISRIRGAILDGLRAFDQVPPSWRQHARVLEQALERLQQELGREPSDEELARFLGWTVEEVQERLGEVGRMSVLSLDEVLFEGQVRVDTLADPQVPDPSADLLWQEARAALAHALSRLSEKERTVVALYYGEGLTVTEIARALRLTPTRISQIHHRAILRLRGMLSRQKHIFF